MNGYDSNKYFFVSLPEPAMEAILAKCVSKTLDKSAELYDGSYLLKLPMNVEVPPVLSSYAEYAYEAMITEKALREKDRPSNL